MMDYASDHQIFREKSSFRTVSESDAKRVDDDLVPELGVLCADRVQDLRLIVGRSAITQEQNYLV